MRFQHIWLLDPVQADAVASSPLGFGSFTESTGLLDSPPTYDPNLLRGAGDTQPWAAGIRQELRRGIWVLNAGINHYARQRLSAQSTPAVRKPTSDKWPPPVAVNLLGEPPFHPSHSTSPKAQVTVRPSLLAPRLSPPPPTSFTSSYLTQL